MPASKLKLHEIQLTAAAALFLGAGWWFSRKAVAAVPDRAPAVPVDVYGGVDFSAWGGVVQAGETLQSAVDYVGDIFTPTADAYEVDAVSADSNVVAFLKMIRYAEGTAGPDGYRTLWGGGLFESFADHPRIVGEYMSNGRPIKSTAAGAYQFLEGTWDDAARKLGLVDFSPASQDRAAIWLLSRRGALGDVQAGRFEVAIAKCAKEWASLPGSPYGQPVKTLAQVRQVYANAGGALA